MSWSGAAPSFSIPMIRKKIDYKFPERWYFTDARKKEELFTLVVADGKGVDLESVMNRTQAAARRRKTF